MIVDPNRAENVITNDGTTMRIVTQAAGKPSAWNRLKEVINEGPAVPQAAIEATQTLPSPPSSSAPADAPKNGSSPDKAASTPASPPADDAAKKVDKATKKAKAAKTDEEPAADDGAPAADEAPADNTAEKDEASDEGSVVKVDAADAEQTDEAGAEKSVSKSSKAPKGSTKTVDDKSSVAEKTPSTKEVAPPAEKPTAKPQTQKAEASAVKSDRASVDLDQYASQDDGKVDWDQYRANAASGQDVQSKPRNRSSSIGNKQVTEQQLAAAKPGPARFQVKEIPTRAPTTALAVPPVAQKPPSEIEIEQARLDRAEKLEMMKQEKELMAEQRAYQRKLELQAREQEQARRLEEQKEQAEIRAEKRAYDKARREAAQKAISEAVAAKKDALTLEDLNKIKAQNQFADRFDGIVNSDTTYSFDASGVRGPSQTVAYSSRFIDKLTDVTEDMAISGALSVKMAKIGGSGRGSFVDSDKFKQSDLNFYISVKVTNQTVNFKDALVYNPMRSIAIGSDDFNKVYGDSFISGFQEGGEFNAIISMKVHNKAKLLDIQAEAKVALTAGPVDITAEANVGIARTNLEMNTETTIQVSWCGGGHIKPMEQPWNIQSVMQAAARFPSLVADCPQRTYAILTKYDSLRSFVSLRPAAYSPIQYENAQIYTGVLMDAFMSYKSLYKKLGDQVSSIQSKILEFEPWSNTDDQDQNDSQHKQLTETPQAKTAMSQAVASGNQSAVSALQKYAAAVNAAADTSRFAASLKGLADARKFIRRQMVYIVNEVDLIEKDPKVATDEDHEEPFQAPLLFETRLPETKIPDALKPKSDPLSGKRIMAKTQTEADLEKEQAEQDELDNTSPALYQMDQNLSTDETTSLDAVRKKNPIIGRHLQVSRAAPETKEGELFNNLDFLFPEWQVESVTIGITDRGCVGSVEVSYENGLILRKGLVSSNKWCCKFHY